MATEHGALRRIACASAAAVAALLLGPLHAAAQPSPAPARTPAVTATPLPGTEPWWLPLAFRGHAVTDVRAESGQITVNVTGMGLRESSDGGRTWHAHVEPQGFLAPAPDGEWQVRDGRIGRVDATGTWHLDSGSPRVAQPRTAGHQPLAALPGRAGLVVAIDVNNVVWRRAGDGTWGEALLLLPQHALAGPPPSTGVAAFTQPLSDAVYLATDGYSVLESTDGGDDWVRAGPGLPDGILAITTDSPRSAVYAATRDGLWLHHLQATPAPPVYAGEDLRLRWFGIAAVCLAAAALSIGGMWRLLRV
jgi:hypothetical protein